MTPDPLSPLTPQAEPQAPDHFPEAGKKISEPQAPSAQSGGGDIDTCTDVALLRLFLKRNIAERQRLEAALHQPAPTPGAPVFLVATGEVYEGQETYTRHEGTPPPLCDFEGPLFAGVPQEPADGDYFSEEANDIAESKRRAAQEPAPPAVLSEATIQGICARISGEWKLHGATPLAFARAIEAEVRSSITGKQT